MTAKLLSGVQIDLGNEKKATAAPLVAEGNALVFRQAGTGYAGAKAISLTTDQ
jgi:hypothetical protein